MNHHVFICPICDNCADVKSQTVVELMCKLCCVSMNRVNKYKRIEKYER